MEKEKQGSDSALDEKLAMAVQKALRAPKPGQLEQLLANELAVALFNVDPLQKIRHILEAYMSLSDTERSEVFTVEEHTLYAKLYSLCISLLNIVTYPMSAIETVQAVPFSFKKDEAEVYLSMFNFSNPKNTYEQLAYGQAHPVNVQQFKVWYITVAMPYCLNVFRRIVERFISSEVWTQTLSALRRSGQR